jgi:2-iminobutanoate/2-iminopropanoate deaminase
MNKKVYDIETFVKGGPYSHIVEAGGFLFLSGIVPVDLEKNLRIKDDIPAATELILNNMKFALETVGSSMADVVKTTVFLRDMGDFEQMNAVYKTFFPDNPPARSCVAVKEVPMNFPLEIEAIACR